ncbi:MAG: hypothetical protein KKA42_05285 [candidate division Zixibacteria bacterium]|nr:hypothetical protein [candidate division Zixibacteria bacterium]
MINKFAIILVVALLMVAFGISTVAAKAKFDNREISERVKLFKSKLTDQEPISRRALGLDEAISTSKAAASARVSLGSSPDADSPGDMVDNTYDDWMYYAPMSQHVGMNGTNDIHFSYVNRDSEGDVRRMGYNVYDPGSGWPHLAGGGCEIQASGEEGREPVLAVQSTGLVVLGGWDEASGDRDVHLFYQTSQWSCFWGTGTQIPPATYGLPGLIDATSSLIIPSIDVQENGGTVYTHVVAVEEGDLCGSFWGPDDNANALVYCRKTGTGAAGTWSDAVIIDTSNYWAPQVCASRLSGNVAVAYTKPSALSIAELNTFSDLDIYFRENTNYGAIGDWAAPITITNYSRTEASYAAWLEAGALYDSEDNLHIIWNAHPVPANPYDAPEYGSWGTEWGSTIFHWRRLASNGDTATSRVHNAEWADGGQPTCGFLGFNAMTAAFATMGECAGRLYVVFVMASDMGAEPPMLTDCGSDISDGFFAGLGELYMCVSSDITGDAWDRYRNITHTYSDRVYDGDGCDSAGFGGTCNHDTKPSLSRSGMDRQTGTLAWTNLGGALTSFYDPNDWDDPLASPIAGVWTNDSIIHLSYMNDHWAGLARSDQGLYTENQVRYIQLGCVEPIVAPLIRVTPASIDYPTHGPNGAQTDITITVHNDGNTGLVVDVIGLGKTTDPGTDWLGVSATSLTEIPFGDNTTFDIQLNKNGVIDNGPTGMQFVDGVVFLKPAADPPANTDSLAIPIHFLIADTLADLAWDTVATVAGFGTTKAAGEDVALTMSNIGSFGHNGVGHVNMDFTVEGEDCDLTGNADAYVYDGSFFAAQKVGTQHNLSTSMHSADFAAKLTWKPLVGGPNGEMGSGETASYDSVYTGRFGNWDTSLVAEQTYYAPRNAAGTPSFAIVKTTVWPEKGAMDDITLGHMIDWDVPADNGSDNIGGVSVASGGYMYLQGTDTLTMPDQGCQDESGRFAADIFLGWHTNTEFNVDPLANNVVFYGTFSDSFHGWWDDASDDSVDNYQVIWDSLAANNTINAGGGPYDQAVFMSYVNTYDIGGTDTLTFYTALVTLKDGTKEELDALVAQVRTWYIVEIRGGSAGCCIGTAGSTQLQGGCNDAEQGVDVGDLTNMIDHLFINFTPLCCVAESDIAPAITGGTPDGSVDVGDLTAMIDHLFINFPALPSCP